MLCPATDNPTSCKIRALNHVLHAKNIIAVETQCELCMVYDQNVMSEGTVRQWCKMFEDRRTNVHDKERSGQPSELSDVKDGASQHQNFCVNFHKFHALFSTRLSQLGYTVTSFSQDGFRKCSRVHTKCRE
jgi:hypothetical protein